MSQQAPPLSPSGASVGANEASSVPTTTSPSFIGFPPGQAQRSTSIGASSVNAAPSTAPPLPGTLTPQQALEIYKKKDTSKVVVRFKAIGNAPIMKNNYFRITAFNKFQAVIQFLRKELGWKPSDSLFLYINSSFSPAPDDTVANLYRCFGTEGHLIVNYSSTAAWG